ncbi:MAG: hypothetical protein R6W48_06580 [Gaiellaceae bacterium]
MAPLAGIELLAHGGVPGAIAEGLIAIAVAGVLGAVWLRERRAGRERDDAARPGELRDDDSG